ncbi:MAG TPA: HetP family heterocyst commitment protein [Coleofasciculaceae cyanobacterium]|jgi:hypothetical protein
MNQKFNYSNSELDKKMTTEQFEQVVKAILSGKYSWACLLILSFAGYNPLHYIPYRTCNRIMKENCPQNNFLEKSMPLKSRMKSSQKLLDLSCLEEIRLQTAEVTGGTRVSSLIAENSFSVIYAR